MTSIPKPKLILAGGRGFLGSTLTSHFAAKGWEIVVLTRNPSPHNSAAREIAWDAKSPGPWCRELEGATALINLCGRSVDCRATPANRKLILDSRVDSTRAIGNAIASCAKPPITWLNSSSATLYRHTLGPAWDETGSDFTPTPSVHDAFSIDVILAWESALNATPTPSTRKVALRTTMILGHASNSVFPVLSRLARFGLGGRMGSGHQFVSWMHHLDFSRAVEWIIHHPDLQGPVNMAAPNPLPNADMMSLFRHSVGMPIGLPATEWMLEIGAFFLRTETELILKSRRVTPGKLLASGFQFTFPTLAEALQDLSAKKSD